MIISTTVIDKAIAKTHRGRIVNLLENDGKDNVIGVYGDRQLLSMVTEERLLSTISQVIGRREDEATLISSISGIDVFSPCVEPYDSDNNVYLILLHEVPNYLHDYLLRPQYFYHHNLFVFRKSLLANIFHSIFFTPFQTVFYLSC